jgi:type II secretion system protein J
VIVNLGLNKNKTENLISDIGNRKGFTLLEVLIATAIMAGIMSVIYASFFTATRNVEQAEKARDESDLVRTLVSKLSSDIANAYVNVGMNPLTIFYGKMVQSDTDSDRSGNATHYDELYLTTLTNWRKPGTPETDLCEVAYYFKQKPDSSGYIMMRREKRQLSVAVPALEGGVEYELTDRVKSLQFLYYNGNVWSNEWATGTTLPNAVQISLLLDDGSTYITKVDVGR